MSSSSVESVRELLNKPWKIVPFPTIKSSDLFSLFLKVYWCSRSLSANELGTAADFRMLELFSRPVS
ncbi:unnamed protein product [Trifolium pratense]|uniref:Uncharacterized protein n=1 Tax=Trifolium pratense TaxID=57577 RepID=A0ACB0M7Z9_TRIPR|nr:unnamed protein product [Trifolium pratense]